MSTRKPIADIPIRKANARLAVVLAFARVTAAIIELEEVSTSIARQLDGTTKPKGKK
jgi:hypothetical protein